LPTRPPGSLASRSTRLWPSAAKACRPTHSQAVAAAQTYLNASDVTGTASIVNGNTIRVTTSSTYNTKFLSIIGLGSMRVTGQAEARIVRVVGGVSQ
jgi:hypothetical protein